MKTLLISSWLATCGEAQINLTLAVFWFSDLSSGFLIHVAKMIEPSAMLRSLISALNCSLSSGEKVLSQGTNLRINLKVHSCTLVELQILDSKFFSIRYDLSQFAEELESHSMRMVFQLVKISNLIR